MAHYYTKEDFDDYKEAFKSEADCLVGLMMIFNKSLNAQGVLLSSKPEDMKFLFDATTELRYHADNLYKHRKGIEDEDELYTVYSGSKYLEDMRNVLKEEIQKTFPSNKND
jgi:hypothetical protein